MAKSWAAVSEVGAGWITKSDHDIFSINGHSPQKPLDVDFIWANITNSDDGNVSLPLMEANRVVEKIVEATTHLGYESKSTDDIMKEIERIADIT